MESHGVQTIYTRFKRYHTGQKIQYVRGEELFEI